MTADADDVTSRLLSRRVVLASGRLDIDLADNVTAQLLALDAVADAPIELVVDLPEAELDPALTLLDVCDVISAPLTVLVSGRLVGAGVALLTTHHRRLARPHATLQLAQPRFAQSHGTADQIARFAQEHSRRIGVLVERLSERTTRPTTIIADDMLRGVFLTADQAVAYGLLDDVLRRQPPPG
jgi:ATP-dependent Clp protease protease subunit